MAALDRGDPFSHQVPESRKTKTVTVTSSEHPDHFSSQKQSVISFSVAFLSLYDNFSSSVFVNVGGALCLFGSN